MSRRYGTCVRCCLVVFAIVSALAVCGPAIYWRFKKTLSLADPKSSSCPPCICDCPPPLSLLKIAPGTISLSLFLFLFSVLFVVSLLFCLGYFRLWVFLWVLCWFGWNLVVPISSIRGIFFYISCAWWYWNIRILHSVYIYLYTCSLASVLILYEFRNVDAAIDMRILSASLRIWWKSFLDLTQHLVRYANIKSYHSSGRHG